MYYGRYFVYIICNKRDGVLYIGQCRNMCLRIIQHQTKVNPNSFSARYNLAKLVFVEEHPTRHSAFTRERQMKKWNRAWKIELIEKENPEWIDLSIDLLKN